MKYNRWTLALISAGLVSVPAVSHADESTNAVMAALSATTISGFVDTSAHWNFGTGNAALPAYTPNGQPGGTKADGFNLDVVELTLSHAAGEGWSAGYNASFLFGPDAVGYNTSVTAGAITPDFALKDAYVDLHAPIGNGLDVKLGNFSEPLGYEVYEAGSNPNYTRSYGYMIEPTQLTGALATYQLCSAFTVSGGIANTWSAGLNSRSVPDKAESYKTYIGSATFTAPTNWGVLAGSTISGGVINGYDAVAHSDKTSWYVGGTFATPITNLKLGAAYDYVNLAPNPAGPLVGNTSGYQQVVGAYANYAATEKLSFNLRGEYETQSGYIVTDGFSGNLPKEGYEVTATLQYDLWKNVLSRIEFRWDHAADATDPYGPGKDNAYLLAANVIYKF